MKRTLENLALVLLALTINSESCTPPQNISPERKLDPISSNFNTTTSERSFFEKQEVLLFKGDSLDRNPFEYRTPAQIAVDSVIEEDLAHQRERERNWSLHRKGPERWKVY